MHISNENKKGHLLKTVAYGIVAGILCSSIQSHAEVSQLPLTVAVQLAPNLLISIDNSLNGMMAFSHPYLLETVQEYYGDPRFYSSTTNYLYYNPNVKYAPPAFFDKYGNKHTLSTYFDQAFKNGYDIEWYNGEPVYGYNMPKSTKYLGTKYNNQRFIKNYGILNTTRWQGSKIASNKDESIVTSIKSDYSMGSYDNRYRNLITEYVPQVMYGYKELPSPTQTSLSDANLLDYSYGNETHDSHATLLLQGYRHNDATYRNRTYTARFLFPIAKGIDPEVWNSNSKSVYDTKHDEVIVSVKQLFDSGSSRAGRPATSGGKPYNHFYGTGIRVSETINSSAKNERRPKDNGYSPSQETQGCELAEVKLNSYAKSDYNAAKYAIGSNFRCTIKKDSETSIRISSTSHATSNRAARKNGNLGFSVDLRFYPFYYEYLSNKSYCPKKPDETVYVANGTNYQKQFNINRCFVRKMLPFDVEQWQNFANWYSFYNTRWKLMNATIMKAFENVGNNVRLTWQHSSGSTGCTGLSPQQYISGASGFSVGSLLMNGIKNRGSNFFNDYKIECGNNLIKPLTAAHKYEFYRFVMQHSAVDVNGNHWYAVRRVHDFLANDNMAWFDNVELKPWFKNINEFIRSANKSDNASKLNIRNGKHITRESQASACRPNYHMMFVTGGYDQIYNSTSLVSYDSTLGRTMEVDSISRTMVDGTRYNARAPYRLNQDTSSASGSGIRLRLSDFAFLLWSQDLRKDLTNNLIPVINQAAKLNDKQYWDARNNPANWQHIQQFVVAFGVKGYVQPFDFYYNNGTPYSSKLSWNDDFLPEDLVKGSIGFPSNESIFKMKNYSNFAKVNASSSTTSYKFDHAKHALALFDLWHAAINSRGDFYTIDDVNGYSKMINTMNTFTRLKLEHKQTEDLAPATLSGRDINGKGDMLNVTYSVGYNSKDWSGSLVKNAEIVYSDSQNKIGSKEKEIKAQDVLNQRYWGRNKYYLQRKIYYMTDSGNKVALKELKEFIGDPVHKNSYKASLEAFGPRSLSFILSRTPEGMENWKSSGSQEYYYFDRTIDPDLAMKYIYGDDSHEGQNGQRLFRQRGGILGDIIGSTPVVVQGRRKAIKVAEKLESSPKESYLSFVNKQEARDPKTNALKIPPVVYVGSNDGMLHAFNGNNMEELWSFMPSAVMQNINKQLYSSYSHQFGVDGKIVVDDVYNKNTGKWQRVLIGSLGAGGKGVFALDVTDYQKPKAMWEWDNSKLNQNSSPITMGYSFAKPIIAKIKEKNGGSRWVAFIGNGYESGGKAGLFVLDAINGSIVTTLASNSSFVQTYNHSGTKLSKPISPANGLSSMRSVDSDLDGYTDHVYAGDLHGNIWRYDMVNGIFSGGHAIFAAEYGDTSSTYPGASKSNSAFAQQSGKNQAITVSPIVTLHPKGGVLVTFATGRMFEELDRKGNIEVIQSMYTIWDKTAKTNTSYSKAVTVSRKKLEKRSLVEEDSYIRDAKGNLVPLKDSSGVQLKTYFLNDKQDVDWYKYDGWFVNFLNTAEQSTTEFLELLGDVYFQTTIATGDDCSSEFSANQYAFDPRTGKIAKNSKFSVYDKDGNNAVSISAPGEGGMSFAFGADNNNISIITSGDKAKPSTQIKVDAQEQRNTWRVLDL